MRDISFRKSYISFEAEYNFNGSRPSSVLFVIFYKIVISFVWMPDQFNELWYFIIHMINK